MPCSTLESVVVGFTTSGGGGACSSAAAQRSKASLSGSRPGRARSRPARRLLNARKRRCRVHQEPDLCRDSNQGCSTLESVVVGFTLTHKSEPLAGNSCSTLESVVVGFTAGGPWRSRGSSALLNARKRRCRVHPGPDAPGRSLDHLLNARKRRCRVHAIYTVAIGTGAICSTLESVVVGFTTNRSPVSRNGSSCSTLESVVVGFTSLTPGRSCRRSLLNARKRRCRVHDRPGVVEIGLVVCSTLESVVVGFTGG